MDPNTTIEAVIEAADRGDRDSYIEALAAYKAWVANGGFRADEELIVRAAHITADRIMFEAEMRIAQMRLPRTPEIMQTMAMAHAAKLAQDLATETAVLLHPVPDTVEELTL